MPKNKLRDWECRVNKHSIEMKFMNAINDYASKHAVSVEEVASLLEYNKLMRYISVFDIIKRAINRASGIYAPPTHPSTEARINIMIPLLEHENVGKDKYFFRTERVAICNEFKRLMLRYMELYNVKKHTYAGVLSKRYDIGRTTITDILGDKRANLCTMRNTFTLLEINKFFRKANRKKERILENAKKES